MVEGAKTTASGSVNGHPPDLGREIQLDDNALTVLQRRYLRRDGNGQPAENVEEMFWRVASHVAAVESDLGGDAQAEYSALLVAQRLNGPHARRPPGRIQPTGCPGRQGHHKGPHEQRRREERLYGPSPQSRRADQPTQSQPQRNAA